jgi:AAA domain
VSSAAISALHGAKVVAVVDRDVSGDGWASKVRKKLDGRAEVEFRQAKEGKDSTDHIMRGFSIDELQPYEPIESEREREPDRGQADDQTAIDRRYLKLLSQVLDVNGLRNIPPPSPLVEGYLFKNSLAWLYGKPGSAKTFVALDLACCVGTGTSWHEHAVEQGWVLYVIAEGASGVVDRLTAWEIANEKSIENVRFLPVPLRLMESLDVAAFAQLLTELQPSLVVVDTQARVTVGAEENSSKDMGLFVRPVALPTPTGSLARRGASPSSSSSTWPRPWTTGTPASSTPSRRTGTSSPWTARCRCLDRSGRSS